LELTELFRFDEDIKKSIGYYILMYKKYKREEHPKLQIYQWKQVVDEWLTIDRDYDDDTEIDTDAINEIIGIHFGTKYTKGNYSIMHFISGEIRKNRFHEWQRSGEPEEG